MEARIAALLGISAGALLAAATYNTCSAETPAPHGVKITSDGSTLTIEAEDNYGESGTRKFIWQQYDNGDECFMRYIEFQDCPYARGSGGSCSGVSYRDFGCDWTVEEHAVKRRGMVLGRSGAVITQRSPETEIWFIRIDELFRQAHDLIESALGASLEEKVEEWRRTRQ